MSALTREARAKTRTLFRRSQRRAVLLGVGAPPVGFKRQDCGIRIPTQVARALLLRACDRAFQP